MTQLQRQLPELTFPATHKASHYQNIHLILRNASYPAPRAKRALLSYLPPPLTRETTEHPQEPPPYLGPPVFRRRGPRSDHWRHQRECQRRCQRSSVRCRGEHRNIVVERDPFPLVALCGRESVARPLLERCDVSFSCAPLPISSPFAFLGAAQGTGSLLYLKVGHGSGLCLCCGRSSGTGVEVVNSENSCTDSPEPPWSLNFGLLIGMLLTDANRFFFRGRQSNLDGGVWADSVPKASEGMLRCV